MKKLTWLLLLLVGCSSTAMLNRIQTSNTYPNKIPLRAAVYIPQEIVEHKIYGSPSTTMCAAWKAEIDAGEGYTSAILSGISSALRSADLVKTMPTPEFAKANGYDIIVSVNLSNENLGITVNEGFLSNTINTQFQVSFILNFMDNQGISIYTYSANGSGFNNSNGGCGDIASAAKISIENALRQVADNIAISTFSGLKK